MNMQTSAEIAAQDLHVDSLIPAGLRSRYAARGRYSWQEQAQRELNVWLVKRYRAEWENRKRATLGRTMQGGVNQSKEGIAG